METDAGGAAAADVKVAITFVVEAAPGVASVFWGEAEGRTEGGGADGSIVGPAVLAGLADDVGAYVDAGGNVSIIAVPVVSAVAATVLVSVVATGGGGGVIDGGGSGMGRGALTGRERVGAEAPAVMAVDTWKSISTSIRGAGGGGNAIGGKGRP